VTVTGRLVIPAAIAVMVVVPVLMALTRPDELIVATERSVLCQVRVAVVTGVPSKASTSAVKNRDSPIVKSALSDAMVTVATGVAALVTTVRRARSLATPCAVA